MNLITAKQNQNFLSIFCRLPPHPPPRKIRKVRKILGFAHASPRACPRRIGSHHHAIGAYETVSATTRSARAKQSGVLLEMGSNFFKQTPPKLICIRIDAPAPKARAWAGISAKKFQGGFEFRQKHSRRKAAVPQANACSVLRTGADAERLQIVGVSAMPLSI